MKATTALVMAAVGFCMGIYVAGEVSEGESHQPATQAHETNTETKTVYKTRVKVKKKVVTKTVTDPDCLAYKELAFEMLSSAEEMYGLGYTQENILSDARKAVHSGEAAKLEAVQRAQNDLTSTGLTPFTDLMETYHSIESMKGCK